MPPTEPSINDYILTQAIHSGKNGEVWLALNKRTKKRSVVKIIDDRNVDHEFIENEIYNGLLLKHPNIVKMNKFWKEQHLTFIDMEFIEGLDLFAYMESRGFKPLSEKHAKKLMRKLVKAVHFMHKRNVVHRDLKLENIIIGHKEKLLKIIDFGMSEKLISEKQLSFRWCGSTDYVCPEILTRTPYSGFKADIWSLGVVLYTLLYAEFPFLWQERVAAYHASAPHPSPEYPSRIPLSREARDLLRRMLEVDPKKRITIEEILSHKWLKKRSHFNFLKEVW